jgi:hypothetical protein
MTPSKKKLPLTLRRIQLFTYRDGGFVGVIPVNVYGETPIDLRGYVGHRDHDELERIAAVVGAPDAPN